MIKFGVFSVEKQTVPNLFWLRMHNVTCKRYRGNHPLITQSFKVLNVPIVLLFSINWVTGLADEDNLANNMCHSLQRT